METTPQHALVVTQGKYLPRVTAVIAKGKRPVPFRTRKLSPSAPMVLHWCRCGRVGRRRTYIVKEPPPATPAGGSFASGLQLEPADVDLCEHLAQQRQTDADDVVVIALDAGDKGTSKTVDREASCNIQRFAGRDVRRDLLVGDVGEVDGGRRDGAHRGAGAPVAVVPVVDQPVAGVQHAGAATHPLPPSGCLCLVGWLAVQLTVELEHGVAAEDQNADGGVLGAGVV